MLSTGRGAMGVNLAVGGAGSARLTASGGPATVAGAGASLVSTSSAEGVVIASAPLAGNTSGVVIVTGTASGGVAGDVSISGGEGAVQGGSVVLRPGAGGSGSGAGSGAGSIALYGAEGGLPHVTVGGAGASVLGLRGVAHFSLAGKEGAVVAPPGAPVLLSAGAALYEVSVVGGGGSARAAPESVAVSVEVGAGMLDGQVVWIVNSPSSTASALLQAADGVLACADDVVIARGRMAGFMTWRCAAGGGGCLLVPLAG
jgi:hypothetical protein